MTVEAGECTACGDCVDACLFGALSLDGGESVIVDGGLCQGCGICRRACQSGALALEPRQARAPREAAGRRAVAR